MKYIKQLLIIMLFVFLGELANHFIPLSIPASIYGMILLFIALCTKIVKLEQIEETGEFLLSIMLIFFVPAAVGIMDTFLEHQSSMLYIVFIVLITTIVVLITTSVVSQLVIKLGKCLKNKDKENKKNVEKNNSYKKTNRKKKRRNRK